MKSVVGRGEQKKTKKNNNGRALESAKAVIEQCSGMAYGPRGGGDGGTAFLNPEGRVSPVSYGPVVMKKNNKIFRDGKLRT